MLKDNLERRFIFWKPLPA